MNCKSSLASGVWKTRRDSKYLAVKVKRVSDLNPRRSLHHEQETEKTSQPLTEALKLPVCQSLKPQQLYQEEIGMLKEREVKLGHQFRGLL